MLYVYRHARARGTVWLVFGWLVIRFSDDKRPTLERHRQASFSKHMRKLWWQPFDPIVREPFRPLHLPPGNAIMQPITCTVADPPDDRMRDALAHMRVCRVRVHRVVDQLVPALRQLRRVAFVPIESGAERSRQQKNEDCQRGRGDCTRWNTKMSDRIRLHWVLHAEAGERSRTAEAPDDDAAVVQGAQLFWAAVPRDRSKVAPHELGEIVH